MATMTVPKGDRTERAETQLALEERTIERKGDVPLASEVILVRAHEALDFDLALQIQKATKGKLYAAYVEEAGLRHLFEKGTISLIKAGEKIVGLTAFLPDERDPILVEHTNLAILPEYQRMGFGSKAWELDLEELRRQGFERVWWVVHPNNTGSRSIVEPGSEYKGSIANYYGDGEPRLVFERKL